MVEQFGIDFIRKHTLGYYIHIELLRKEKSLESLGGNNASWTVNYGLVDWFSSDSQRSAYRPLFTHPTTGSEIRFDDLITKHCDIAQELLHQQKFAVIKGGLQELEWGEYRVVKANRHSFGPCEL